jgi:nucleotide-binding universal stress UspA family protein
MLEPAVALGRLSDAEYTLLRVIQPVLPVQYHLEGGSLAQMAGAVVEQIDALEAQVRKAAADYLDGVAGRLRRQGLRVGTKVVAESQPAAAILQEAADLIALETHGRHGLARLLLGSVADKVIRGAAVPVLVHRPVSS